MNWSREDGKDQFTAEAAVDVIFGQASDPDIQILWSCIDRCESRLQSWIRSNFSKSRFGRQTEILPDLIIARQAVIAAPLNVE